MSQNTNRQISGISGLLAQEISWTLSQVLKYLETLLSKYLRHPDFDLKHPTYDLGHPTHNLVHYLMIHDTLLIILDTLLIILDTLLLILDTLTHDP